MSWYEQDDLSEDDLREIEDQEAYDLYVDWVAEQEEAKGLNGYEL